MRRGARHDGVAGLLSLVALTGLIAAALAELIVRRASPHWDPGLAIAVFGTFLTSMAIIAAFSIEERSRWPTPWEVLDGAYVLAWFLIALASVVVALFATAVDGAFLNAFSLTLALGGLLLGALALWSLFSLSSDRGRGKLVVDLLARSIRAPDSSPGRGGADLGEIDTEDHVPAWFLDVDSPELPRHSGVSIELVPSVLRLYADRIDADAIVRLIDEVHAAATQALAEGDWGEIEDYLARIDTLLGVQRGIFEELARRVLSGRLGEVTASGALARAGEAVIDITGRARTPPTSAAARDLRRAEALATRHLTALCRLAGAAAEQADATLRTGEPGSTATYAAAGPERARLLALSVTCTNLQQAARWAVDPDPPGMKMPSDHPWRTGLSDPESSLVWLWSAAESPSGAFGVGLYALCETLTRCKFFGSYWDGADVFTELDRRLSEDGTGPELGSAQITIDRAGGLQRLALELAAARLAVTPARAHAGASDREAKLQDDRHVACNLFLAGGGYKPAGRDAHADLAWLLTDRLEGSLWTMVQGQLQQLPEPLVRPPLRPLHRHPAACVLALCLRLAPLASGPEEKELEPVRSFVETLPPPLLEGAAALALRLTKSEQAELPAGRAEQETELVNAARFAGWIVPESSPRVEALAEPTPAKLDTDPGPTAGPRPDLPGPESFVDALGRLAAAESPLEVNMIQCDRRWLDEWAELRAELDASLLAAGLLRGVKLRRVVLLNLPGDAEERLTRLHYRWTDALSTAVGCFEAPAADSPVQTAYEVRQLILPFSGPARPAPADCVVLRGLADAPLGADEAARFESVWERFDPDARIGAGELGLIALGGREPVGDGRSPSGV